MGGAIGYTKIKNGKREHQHRWTNAFPDFFNSYSFHFPKSPEAFDEYIREHDVSYIQMQEDWDKNGPDGPFEHNMTDFYFGTTPRFAPKHYGALVVDFDKKIVYHCQGYSDFGTLHDSINLVYSEILSAREDGKKEIFVQPHEAEFWKTEVEPLLDENKIQAYYMTTIDREAVEKENGIYNDVGNRLKYERLGELMKPLPLDEIKYGDNFEMFKKTPQEIMNRNWVQRNWNNLPEDFKVALEAKQSSDQWYEDPFLDISLGIKSDWRFIRYDESKEGFELMMQDMDKEYGLTPEDKEAWQKYIQHRYVEAELE